MHRLIRGFVFAVIPAAVAMMAVAPRSAAATEPGTTLIGIYRVAAGKHTEFLKWQAARDAIDKQAGVPQAQWYAHTDGDSWDYLSVGPVLSDAQQKKVDEATRAKGMALGFKASLEFRQYISSHTDTYAIGPMTVTELSAMASGK
ncbi:hypothetical protein [Dokdonella soli]|uniref:Uncharacterized protein n=1 Tax=Dokdonella soli TaxID=529810 RepID=A0ABP3TT74_9GAMM